MEVKPRKRLKKKKEVIQTSQKEDNDHGSQQASALQNLRFTHAQHSITEFVMNQQLYNNQNTIRHMVDDVMYRTASIEEYRNTLRNIERITDQHTMNMKALNLKNTIDNVVNSTMYNNCYTMVSNVITPRVLPSNIPPTHHNQHSRNHHLSNELPPQFKWCNLPKEQTKQLVRLIKGIDIVYYNRGNTLYYRDNDKKWKLIALNTPITTFIHIIPQRTVDRLKLHMIHMKPNNVYHMPRKYLQKVQRYLNQLNDHKQPSRKK